MSTSQSLVRTAVFYDGNLFNEVSTFYKYQHQRKARISLAGLHEFIRHKVSDCESADINRCHIVEAHYFRGRFSASATKQRDDTDRAAGKSTTAFERQAMFDEVLIRAGVVQHYYPMDESGGKRPKERGIDVWLALEAYDLAVHKRFDVLTLIAGDTDYVPLVRKLNSIGTRVMLLGWDFEYGYNGDRKVTRTSQALIKEVSYPVMMHDEIDSRARKGDAFIDNLFCEGRTGTDPATSNAHLPARSGLGV